MTFSRRWVALVFLLLVAGLQVRDVFDEYAARWIKAAWRTRDLTSLQRSALFYIGRGGMEYLDFLRRSVSEDQAFVLAFRAMQFSDQNSMQFFLLPRAVVECPCEGTVPNEMSEECKRCLLKPDHSVPAIADFPPAELLRGAKQFIPFSGDSPRLHGVYVPLGGVMAGSAPGRDWTSSGLPAAAIDLAIYGAIFVLGACAAGSVLRRPAWGDLLALSFPLGLGSLTLAVFVMGWAGSPITASTFVLVFLGLLLLFGATRQIVWGKLHPFPRLPAHESFGAALRNHSPLGAVVIVALFGVAALAVLVSLTRGYSTFDEIANWALKGYAIAFEKTILAGERWGGHGLAYPQNLHLSIALFRLVDGDLLPGSKILFPLLAGSMAFGCFHLWRKVGVDRLPASLAVLVLLTVPAFFLHTTLGFANLPFTSYIVLGVLWLLKAALGGQDGELVLGGALLGLAGWTRPEGAGFGFVMLAVLAGSAWIVLRKRVLRWSSVVPFMLPSLLWLVFSSQFVAGDEIGRVIRGLASRLATGDVNLVPVLRVLAFAGDRLWSSDWRAACILLGSLLALGIWRRDRPGSQALLTILPVALAAILVPLLMFSAALYAEAGYGTTFLEVSFDRAMFPAITLLFWAAVAGCAAPPVNTTAVGARALGAAIPG